ncbi:hypothetical protein [Sporosarcina sp. OR05]|uniref:hypothetical protein n=1 Tax=Sporosarcina sp. OR05 TaxID=2969819 RepID=UPI00352B8B48
MTVLIAMAAYPPSGEKPYVLFGSDSLEVIYSLAEDGVIEVDDRNESQQKIFRKHDKLFAFAGLFESSLVLNLMNFLDSEIAQETEIETTAEIILGFIRGQMFSENVTVYNISVIIGQIDKSGKPSLLAFDVNKDGLVQEPVDAVTLENELEYWVIPAGEEPSFAIKEKFQEGIEKSNLDMALVEQTIERFLKEAAGEYSETCNQDIKIKKLPL